MEFDKKDEVTQNENDCISKVEANCCNVMTRNVSYLFESNRWMLTVLSRLFFLGNVVLFEYLYVSSSIHKMTARHKSTPFIVVSQYFVIFNALFLDIYTPCEYSCSSRGVLLRQSAEE